MLPDLFVDVKSVRMVDKLTRLFPAKWTWHRRAREWRSALGRVSRCAAWTPQHEGDDENFTTETWFYPITGSPQRVY